MSRTHVVASDEAGQTAGTILEAISTSGRLLASSASTNVTDTAISVSVKEDLLELGLVMFKKFLNQEDFLDKQSAHCMSRQIQGHI
jgi:hypothetical protein